MVIDAVVGELLHARTLTVRIRPAGLVDTHTMDTHTVDTHTTQPIDEVAEFVSTLFATPAHRLTACRGWTAHELVAHLAAGAAEEADLIESHLARAPERPTRTHEARELPYRALPDPELRDAARRERRPARDVARPAGHAGSDGIGCCSPGGR